jgi:hypothetical protein
MDDHKKNRDADNEPVRQGDILGLGGAPVPKTPGEASRSSERERERGFDSTREDEEDERTRHENAYRRSSGATSVDMGSGGSGTDVE